MKFRNSTLLIFFFLGVIQVSAQGFAGFAYPDPDTSISFDVLRLDSKQMFGNYIAAHFPREIENEGGVRAFLLIPENGCQYCIGHTLRFYRDHRDKLAGLRLIVGGYQIDPSYGFKEQEFLDDVQKAYKSYGFDGAFPTFVVMKDREVVAIYSPDSETIDADLKALHAQLKGN